MKKTKLIIIIISIFFQLFSSSIVLGDVLKIGNENAKITVKVFSSLTCPHCASFHEKIYEELKEIILIKIWLNLNIMLSL